MVTVIPSISIPYATEPIFNKCSSRESDDSNKRLYAGANVNAHTSLGNTVLMWAAREGQANVVRRLIRAGGMVLSMNLHVDLSLLYLLGIYTCIISSLYVCKWSGAKTNAQDRDGRTALSIAYEWGHHDVAKALTAAGEHLSKSTYSSVGNLVFV